MKKALINFFITRDWKMIFLKSSAHLFWFYFLIAIGIGTIRPMRDYFLDWIVRHNTDYFIDYLNWLLENGYAGPKSMQPNVQILNSTIL